MRLLAGADDGQACTGGFGIILNRPPGTHDDDESHLIRHPAVWSAPSKQRY